MLHFYSLPVAISDQYKLVSYGDHVNVWVDVDVPQVPSEDWGGGYSGGGAADSGGEIPCRRMRSGSYIKAMGDDDSADSDTSPKASPKSTLIAQREAFRRSISMDQRSDGTNSAFIFMLKYLYLPSTQLSAFKNRKKTSLFGLVWLSFFLSSAKAA